MAEVVGFILGAVPLIVSALEHYRDGLDVAKDYWRYSSNLKSLQTRLRIEHSLYQGTLKRLLLSELSLSQVEDLFPDPQQPLKTALWGTEEIEEKLRVKLGDKYDTFMDAIREMEEAIEKLMDKLDIDLQGKVSKPLFSRRRRRCQLLVLAQVEWEIWLWCNSESLADPSRVGVEKNPTKLWEEGARTLGAGLRGLQPANRCLGSTERGIGTRIRACPPTVFHVLL
jgi:hypothetical protein